MNVGEKIKIRRKELRLSADQLAERLGKDRSTIYRYESKEIEKLPIDIIEPLAEALSVSPQYLMGWEEEKNSPGVEEKTPRERKYEEIISLLQALPEEKVTEAVRYLRYLAEN